MEALFGIADGVFAAALAARRPVLVPPGQTRRFLAPLDIEVLDRPELVELMRRLGIRTLGAFAALPERGIASRFGPDAAQAHRLVRGLGERPLLARRPPVDLTVSSTPDPPVERVDTAAFVARTLAEQLHDLLAGHGFACTRLRIEAQTEHGEELSRVWRHDGVLTAVDIADRVRWQLDGWLTGRARRHQAHRRNQPAAAGARGARRARRAAARTLGRRGRGRRAGAPGAGQGPGHARPRGGLHRGARRRT